MRARGWVAGGEHGQHPQDPQCASGRSLPKRQGDYCGTRFYLLVSARATGEGAGNGGQHRRLLVKEVVERRALRG